MITPEEYKQFKAFTRQDGALVGAVMALCFLLLRGSLSDPSLQFAYIMGMLSVPVLIALRVRNYRDKVVRGRISKMRIFGFCISCFMYASLILGMVVFVYFKYFDQGTFVGALKTYISMPEMQKAIVAYGVTAAEIKNELDAMAALRPVDVALSMITNTFTVGLFCSAFITLFSRREARVKN